MKPAPNRPEHPWELASPSTVSHMAIFGRKRDRIPSDAFDDALRAEHVDDEITGDFRADMLKAWIDVHDECGVSARDFLRIALRRPTKVDQSMVAAAGDRVAQRRGIHPPADKWASDDMVAHHVKILDAIASGAAGDRIEQLMEAMPSYPTNTGTHIMLMLQNLGRITADRGYLLKSDVGAADPMLGVARHLIDLASRDRWDEAKIAVLDLCDPDPETPGTTGEPGRAMEGLLLGLLHREFGSGA